MQNTATSDKQPPEEKPRKKNLRKRRPLQDTGQPCGCLYPDGVGGKVIRLTLDTREVGADDDEEDRDD